MTTIHDLEGSIVRVDGGARQMETHEALIQAGWSIPGLFACGIHEICTSDFALNWEPDNNHTLYAHGDYHANTHTDNFVDQHEDSHNDSD
jgi:hypothetical protein